MKWLRGTAAFWGTLISQVLVLALYFLLPKDAISYLWYNVIGAAACVVLATVIQAGMDLTGKGAAPAVVS